MRPHGADDDGLQHDDDSRLFAGVRFALAGFDSVSESQYRTEMVRRGGADAGWYGAAGCTHVVVCGLVYDDPVCVAAREDGKKVVTELWVDDSLDTGAMADADRVLYRPVRDLDGIPGSESLNICLTGYQKNRREDIMKMVTLMGAQFSKPLLAHKVTHLICYKFEGEKYELAKKVNINLVNHQWLEDSLNVWEILPIDNYTKSGWELDMMEAQAKDSEDEAEDTGRGSSGSRGIARSIPIKDIRMRTHADPNVCAPINDPTASTGEADIAAGRHLGTPKQVSKAEDVSKSSLDVRADIQSTHNTNRVTISADPDAHDSIHHPINPSSNEEAPADQVIQDETKDGDKWALNTRANALYTPNTSGVTVCADHLVHQPILTPAIPVDNIHCFRKEVDSMVNIDGKCLDNANQVDINNVLLPIHSGDLLEKTLHSSDMSGKVDQKDDGLVADLVTNTGQSNVEGNLTLCKANLISAGNSATKNTPILGHSRRRSRKSVSPGDNLKSVHQSAPPQSFVRNTPNGEFNISPSRESNHKSSELADAQSLRGAARKSVEGSDCALAQRKSRLSSASPIPPNGGTESATGTASSPFSSKEIASAAATVSDLGRNSRESQPIKVDGHLNSDPTVNLMEKQNSGSSKKKLLSYRRTSLKLARSSEVEKLPENFANEKNMESLVKAKELEQHETTAEKGCTISPSIDSEVGKASSTFSLQNGDIEMNDTPQVNNTEVVAPNSHDKVVAHATMEAGAKKVPTSELRKAGTKRSRNSKSEVAAPKSKHNKVVSHENVEAEPEKISSAAECTILFPEKILSSRARSVVAKSSLDANSEMNGVLADSKMEFANVILQGNVNKTPKKLSSSANADEYQRGLSGKVPNAIARNAVGKVSRPANIKMSDAPTADKTETGSLKSSFSEAVPQAYTEKLSNSAIADNRDIRTPGTVPENRVRKVVAKRKISAVQQHRSASEPCKTGGVIPSEGEVITSKGAAEGSTNAGKATVNQDPQNAYDNEKTNEGGSFCKDSLEDKSKGMQNTNPRSSKRKKNAYVMDDSTDHNKKNIPVDGNLTPKSKYGNNCVSSKCITKAVQNCKGVLGDCSMREGNDCGTLIVLEPTWFILSGHRLLRKEYKLILRHLKGRVCRDSHHWSFQATHFITPELRRTEKFFAAAAAGRWILKSDYLTACNEAGKFVEEEPFEWHGHGLNNGDTISLDAPRKWRHLRHCTGHGAFHGMQIIIYGECISPSLDTMKRAVRAGDGTILATSPPYTRFLKPGVSFAVVSAGVPSTDAWVQEFMSHKIPCISADYLVEYVCRPGHPLNKHVLFDMHNLADESLQRLQNSQHNVVGAGEATEGGDAEPSCSACGSNDREGVMLICRSEGNQAGCGAGMHVDCRNLGLQVAPDGEWLCPKCDDHVKPPKNAKKAAKSGVLKRR